MVSEDGVELRSNGIFESNSPFVSDLLNALGLNAQEEAKERRRKYRTAIEQYLPPSVIHAADGGDGDGLVASSNLDSSHPGDMLLDTVTRYLNKVYRSPQQKEFHNGMLASCLRVFYNDDFEREKHRVMIKYQFASRKQQVLICAPRRMGKTFATALLAAVLVIVVPDIEVSIFSPGKRQSVALMGVVVDFVAKLGESDRIIQRNEEKMKVRSLDGSISKLNAYPSAVRTLKGVSGTVVILEELAQIPPEVLYEVVVPLHQLERTSIIGISTITSEDNFFTKYLEQKDLHGEPLFAVTHIHLACKPCRDKDEAHKCNHNAHLLPAWSSKRKRKIINAIMRGQEEMLAREIGGVASALHQRAFSSKLITQFYGMERISLPYGHTYDYVFHSIDPAAAGKQSEIAITSVIRRGGMHIIVGLESFPCKTAKENHSLIIEHVNQLRADQRFQNTMSVFIIESNLGMESDHMAVMLEENIGFFVVMNERDDGVHTGFRTTHNMKMLAVENLREKIMDGAVRIATEDTMTCVSRPYSAVVDMLINQMKEFREMLKPSEIAQPKKFYSGKVGGGKDDLLMALLLNVHWSGYFYRSTKYEHFHR